MTNPQLYPLEVNPITGEPFLRLRRHRNIIITPPRAEDAPRMLGPMNDERVHIWLSSPPYPYLLSHAETWIAKIKEQTDSILEALESARDKPELVVTDGCPVRFLREIREDGSELFIGDVGIIRGNHGEVVGLDGLDWDNKAKYEAENKALPVGDARIVWSIGDFLIGSHHGRGIMTDAVGTVIEQWAVERMKTRRIMALTFLENIGSQRVFAKNGFTETRRVAAHSVVKGVERGIVVLEWTGMRGNEASPSLHTYPGSAGS